MRHLGRPARLIKETLKTISRFWDVDNCWSQIVTLLLLLLVCSNRFRLAIRVLISIVISSSNRQCMDVRIVADSCPDTKCKLSDRICQQWWTRCSDSTFLSLLSSFFFFLRDLLFSQIFFSKGGCVIKADERLWANMSHGGAKNCDIDKWGTVTWTSKELWHE